MESDIASTAAAYAQATLADDGPLGADAVTLSPWLGRDTLDPFLALVRSADKGICALVRTSNPGGGPLQVGAGGAEIVAGWIRALNADLAGPSGLGPVGAVVGATRTDEAAALRAAMPRAWFLVPGYGAQGAGAGDVVGGFAEGLSGAVVNSSRGILFAHRSRPGVDWRDATRDAARGMREEIVAALSTRA